MNVAYIPVRGGSKSIPLKNIKHINGLPLVYWTIKAAYECKSIDKVFIATDSDIIKNTVNDLIAKFFKDDILKCEVIGRSAESASDSASTEFAMLEFADNYSFDNIVLIQATSPLLQACDLENGFKAYNENGVDSVISVVKQKRFNWAYDEHGYAYAVNYDIYKRPRRQEFEGYFVENGAFYITSRDLLIKSRNRISGNIKMVEMNENSFLEIDEPEDWDIIEVIMRKNLLNDDKSIPNIKMFITDCDGCLTDGGMYYSESGDELKKFNTKDGMGFKQLHEKGIITGIITGEDVELNKRRAKKMGIDFLIPSCHDKVATILKICDEKSIPLENVCYVGDDINDIGVLEIVGYGCAPANAISLAKSKAKYISSLKGGEGAVRDIIDRILGNY